jgi:hypothetical protein
MRFNLYIETQSDTFNILNLDEVSLNKVVEAYNNGKTTFFLKGKKYWLSKLHEIQIYTFGEGEIKTVKELVEICNRKHLVDSDFFGNTWLPKKVLGKVGKRVTDKFITEDFGNLKSTKTKELNNDVFVEQSRIEEIKTIKNEKFDFTRLVEILCELNIAFNNNLLLVIPPLVRATIDHIPPVFGKSNFKEVSGSYGNRSFQDSMNNLDKSSRKIADSYLHTQIRAKEVLPTLTQINFKHDIDVLLQEIVRINKN